MKRSLAVLYAALLCFALAAAADSPKPHILFVMADDLGWFNVGWRNPEVKTPHTNKLVAEGVDLQRHCES